MKAEVQLVREVLEGALAPAVATSVLFEALDRWDRGIPADAGEVLELVRGPLALALARKLDEDGASQLVAILEARLVQSAPPPSSSDAASDSDFEVDVEIDLEEDLVSPFVDAEDELTSTTQMAAVSHPVSVLVVSGELQFGLLLKATLGEDRVHTLTVKDDAALRHATFSANPQLVVVDATAPPNMRSDELAAALTRLPDATLPVLWALDTPFGRETRSQIQGGHPQSGGMRTLFLEREEGIEPLLDLILSRFRRRSTIPPPS